MSNDEHSLLVEVQKDIRERYIPVIVSIAIFGFVGFIGNVFTVGFYGFKSQKSTSIFLIACLAVIDGIVCVLTAPLILERYYNIIYTEPAACKTQHFFGHWGINSSVFVLWLIAVDRHRKICRPFWRQISIPTAKKFVVGIVIIALILSLRDFANFDTNTIQIELPNNMSITGHWCTNTDDPDLKLSVIFFHAVDVIELLFILVTLIITYGHIVYTLYKMKKFEKKRAPNFAARLNDSEITKPRDILETEGNLTYVKFDEEEQPKTSQLETKQKEANKLKKSEINITIMMLVVSVGFVTCFLPYFSVKLGIRSSKTAIYEMGLGIQFLLVFPYLNSIINPIIFCVFNPKFRKYIIGTIKTCSPRRGLGVNSSKEGPSGMTDENQLSSIQHFH